MTILGIFNFKDKETAERINQSPPFISNTIPTMIAIKVIGYFCQIYDFKILIKTLIIFSISSPAA